MFELPMNVRAIVGFLLIVLGLITGWWAKWKILLSHRLAAVKFPEEGENIEWRRGADCARDIAYSAVPYWWLALILVGMGCWFCAQAKTPPRK